MHRRKPFSSLAGRLTALFALSAFLLLASFSLFLFWVLSRNLEREDDAFLQDRLQSVSRLLASGLPGAETLRHESERCFLRIQDPAGRTVFETPSRPEHLRRLSQVTPLGWQIEAAMDARQDDAFRSDFIRMTAFALLLGTVASAGLGYGVARRGLRPLHQIAQKVKGIGAEDLTPRIAAQDWPEELHTLAASFDDLLARLDESFQRLSRFSADIAHELRTPITNLRGEVEVALMKGRTPEQYQAVLGSALEEYERLARLIDSLLFLARAENPEASLQRELLDARQEAEQVVEFYRSLALESGITLRVEGSGNLHADRALVARALANLLENALAHTPEGGTVLVSVATDELCVSDTGCGIESAHLPYLFDRLYRADPARQGGGSGLGLALVRTIAHLHGGEARVQSEPSKGTKIMLTLAKPQEIPGKPK